MLDQNDSWMQSAVAGFRDGNDLSTPVEQSDLRSGESRRRGRVDELAGRDGSAVEREPSALIGEHDGRQAQVEPSEWNETRRGDARGTLDLLQPTGLRQEELAATLAAKGLEVGSASECRTQVMRERPYVEAGRGGDAKCQPSFADP